MTSRPPAYNGNEPYVFISYSRADADMVYPIIAQLQKGLRVWYDQAISGGSDFKHVIVQHLEDCVGTICFVTPAFLESSWCLKEIDFAAVEKKHVMIIYLDTIKLPSVFRFDYGHINALYLQRYSGIDALAQEIINTPELQACRLEEAPEEIPADAPRSPAAPTTEGKKPAAKTKKAPPKPKKAVPQVPEPTPEELYTRGKKAYDAKDEDTAIPLIRKAAEMGYAPAQHLMGELYYYPSSLEESYDKTIYWYQKAAEQNYIPAINALGECYQEGRYDEESDDYIDIQADLAFSLFQKAAALGDPEGMYHLAGCYESGTGVTKDIAEAIRLYCQSAELGFASAQWYLGLCYQEGRHINSDLSAAAFWYRKAAEQGDGHAQFHLGELYFFGAGVPQSDELAYEWMHKPAANVSLRIKDYEVNGKLPPLTPEECLRRAKLISQTAHFTSQYKHYSGKLFWYQKAADAGGIKELFELASQYHKRKDFKLSSGIYQILADKGQTKAIDALGFCYELGLGVPRNAEKALELYHKAVELGSTDAMCHLGNYYKSKLDHREAIKWFKKASNLGSNAAKIQLELLQPPRKRLWPF